MRRTKRSVDDSRTRGGIVNTKRDYYYSYYNVNSNSRSKSSSTTTTTSSTNKQNIYILKIINTGNIFSVEITTKKKNINTT